jgi:hypothetical protein
MERLQKAMPVKGVSTGGEIAAGIVMMIEAGTMTDAKRTNRTRANVNNRV